MKALLALAALAAPLFVAVPAVAQAVPDDALAAVGRGGYVSALPGRGRFPLVSDGRAAPLVVSAGDHAGVIRVVDDLQADIAAVTGVTPVVAHDRIPVGRDPVLVGTVGKSPLIDRLVADGRLDV